MAEEVQIRNSTEQAKVRSPAGVAVLSIVTIGIYFFVWWYKVNKEMAEFGRANGTDELGDSPGKSLLAVTLGILLIVPPFVSLYRGGQRMQAAARLSGRDEGLNGWIAIVLYFVISPLMVAYMQSDLNKTWERQASPAEEITGGGGGQVLAPEQPVTEPAPRRTDDQV